MPGLDGVLGLFAFRPLFIKSPCGYVSLGIPLKTVYGQANQAMARNLMGLGVATLFVLLAAYLFGYIFVLRRVSILVGVAHKLTAGDLDARTGLVYGKGELDLLARAFDNMALTLQKRKAERDYAETQLAHKAEELARSNAELEQFAYVASHDLQEPLRMVSSFTQLLARRYKGRLDQDADEFIGFAVDGAARMHKLINDLLDYSRVGNRGKPFEPTDCEALLHRTLSNLHVAIEENEARITHDPLPTVVVDESQIIQLFQNLIGNALKFHGSTPPHIHLAARQNGHEYIFSVADNGIGIDPQYHERVFVIFQRLHGREKYPGTGIGLAICKKIVERHGGRIWLESEPGQGSIFFFSIPKREVNDLEKSR